MHIKTPQQLCLRCLLKKHTNWTKKFYLCFFFFGAVAASFMCADFKSTQKFVRQGRPKSRKRESPRHVTNLVACCISTRHQTYTYQSAKLPIAHVYLFYLLSSVYLYSLNCVFILCAGSWTHRFAKSSEVLNIYCIILLA